MNEKNTQKLYQDFPRLYRGATKGPREGGGSYLHDFTDFMNRHGRGWSGDFSGVVEKYL
jgi:hypothetical protein